MSTDVITNSGSQVFPYYPGPKLRDFSVTQRNARGQILTSNDPTQSDRVIASYSGLGHLQSSNLHQDLLNVSQGAIAKYASGDSQTYDGLGNTITTQFVDSIHNGSTWSTSPRAGGNSYTTDGRLDQHQDGVPITTYHYDASGNGYFEQTRDGGPNASRERTAYYGADEKLVASDLRSSGRRYFEEYRYDALGRRVWVRSVTTCASTNAVECLTSFVRRTIWDGFQELAEIQVPIDENPNTEEMDTGYPLRMDRIGYDPNTFFGRVVYGPVGRVDQPISVTRYDYRDKFLHVWPRFAWQVYWNYQGLPAYGTLTTGAWAYPYQLDPTHPSCPAAVVDLPRTCVNVQWPLAHSAYDQNRGNVAYFGWQGSLLDGKRDRSGLAYKRNRQYDPQTGRFTQEDLLGLAGGLNLYGFAAGDPVTFSDPFGLCKEGVSADSAKSGGRRTTVIYCADSTVETRRGGSWACRNNNPGNLRGSSLQAGRVGGFAVFSTRTVGHEALWRWVQAHAASGSTLRQMIETYAPPSENNTAAYIDYVSNATGLDADATVSTLEGTVQPLVNSIERYEGWNACSVSVQHQ